MKAKVNRRNGPDVVLALAVLVLVAVLAADCLQSIAGWLHQLSEHPPAVALLKAVLEVRGGSL